MISNIPKKLQLEVSLALFNKVSLFVDGNYRGVVLKDCLIYEEEGGKFFNLFLLENLYLFSFERFYFAIIM